MTNMNDVYQKLTSVDIEQQRRLWDERGKGYYGEYLLFKELYTHVTGSCKILMNLQIPTYSGHTTEIDLLLIHETGLYVFEVKHYKGTIYGKSSDRKWTQYFRTAPNSHFYNPIAQNQYHIDALTKRFPGIPIRSFVVFTSSECDLRVENNNADVTVCKLQNLHMAFSSFELRRNVFDTQRIDIIFNELAEFSPLTTDSTIIEGEVVPFSQFSNTMIEDFQKEKAVVKESCLKSVHEEGRKARIAVALAIVAACTCIVICAYICIKIKAHANAQIAVAQQKMESFAQKFEEVEDFNNGELSISKNLVTASNVVLETSPDLENAVSFSCSLEYNGLDYGVSIGKNAVLIMILKDGAAKECPVYNDLYPYQKDFRLGNTKSAWYGAYSHGEILRHEFYDVSLTDISYIKLSNLDIWTEVKNQPQIVVSGFEIELWKAE